MVVLAQLGALRRLAGPGDLHCYPGQTGCARHPAPTVGRAPGVYDGLLGPVRRSERAPARLGLHRPQRRGHFCSRRLTTGNVAICPAPSANTQPETRNFEPGPRNRLPAPAGLAPRGCHLLEPLGHGDLVIAGAFGLLGHLRLVGADRAGSGCLAPTTLDADTAGPGRRVHARRRCRGPVRRHRPGLRRPTPIERARTGRHSPPPGRGFRRENAPVGLRVGDKRGAPRRTFALHPVLAMPGYHGPRLERFPASLRRKRTDHRPAGPLPGTGIAGHAPAHPWPDLRRPLRAAHPGHSLRAQRYHAGDRAVRRAHKRAAARHLRRR